MTLFLRSRRRRAGLVAGALAMAAAPLALAAPLVSASSVASELPCGCHWSRSPLVAMETTVPGRVSAPTCRFMYSARDSAAHCERSSRVAVSSRCPQ
jgi:hypothetical protein